VERDAAIGHAQNSPKHAKEALRHARDAERDQCRVVSEATKQANEARKG